MAMGVFLFVSLLARGRDLLEIGILGPEALAARLLLLYTPFPRKARILQLRLFMLRQ
jgi:hypothetical protein